MRNWTTGDVSGSQTLTVQDHLYASLINELRAAATVYNVRQYGAVGDGVADDQAALKAALADAALAGGVVFIPIGTYRTSKSLSLSSGMGLMGEGYNSIIRPDAAAGISLHGISNIFVRDVQFDGSNSPVNGHLIDVKDCSSVTFDNIDATDCGGFGLFIHASGSNTCEKITVRGSRLNGLGNNDVIGGGADNSTGAILRNINIDGNFVYQDASLGNNYANAIDIVGVYRGRFVNNTAYGGVLFGSEAWPHHHAMIQNNTVKPANGATVAPVGILVSSSGIIAGDAIIISNNTIENGYISAVNAASSYLFTNLAIVGNIVNGNGTVPSSTAAILLTNIDGGSITGNVVEGSTSDGIWLSNSGHMTVVGNTVMGSAGVGLRETGGSNDNLFANNYSVANVGGNSNLGGSRTVNFNNHGINPQLTAASGNVSGAVTFRRSNGHIATATQTGNITVTLADGSAKGEVITLDITTAGFSQTWPANLKLAGGAYVMSGRSTLTAEWDGSNWIEVSRASNVS